ncbi:MAG: CRISPR system Cascade subunit CasE [bacterium]|jgi:CRISPR system Cascade subunit CasE
MIVLSQLTLRKQKKVQSVYQLHKKLWKAFDDGNQEKKRDFLFRIENESDSKQVVLVQSKSIPQWEKALSDDEKFLTKQVTPHFYEGQTFFFYLRANAVIAKKNPEGKSRKCPLHPKEYLEHTIQNKDSKEYEEKKGWLQRQAEQKGFKILEAQSVKVCHVNTRKRPKDRAIELSGQDLQGYLQVIDPEEFKQAFYYGLGRAKAFGFGMFSLSKA